jgi:thiol-disulfide isomerase/thioredoxin
VSRSARAVAALLAGWLLAAAPPEHPLELVDLQGHAVSLGLEGNERALVVHFFATWCPSCGEEIPDLERAAAACRGHGVRVVAVDVGEAAHVVARYAREHGIGLPLLLDPKGRAFRELGLRGLPANRIVTPDGARLLEGPSSAAAWRERLAALGCAPAAASPATP